MKQIAPVLAFSGTASNRIKNYWVQEGGRAFLPCLSYGNPPPLTRYHSYIDQMILVRNQIIQLIIWVTMLCNN